ncbi:FadR/GntR family transcriptional regulator [Peribacillus sp. NPDC097206]|uniref:FadR/GntR family transcriptional regulator n=1 Tax=unclassified Peribacillus TaxID=2675266 RepID=UPI003827C2BB
MIHTKKLLSLSEQIAEQIKDSLINKDLKPGDKLPGEKELANEFQVSRPTVRDAIKILSSSKLVITKPGAKGGHFITEFDPDSFVSDFSDYITLSLSLKGITLEEVIEMRKMIEIKSCGIAAAMRTDEDLIRLKSLIPKIDSVNDSHYFRDDFKFHRAIAKATKNRLIMINIEAISEAIIPYFQSTDCSTELKEGLNKELHGIYKAIEQKDPKAAEEKMKEHLNHFINFIPQFESASKEFRTS